MNTIEKIRADIKRFQESIAELPNMMDSYYAVDFCLDVLDKYASEECDNDCEHCAYIECPKEPCEDAISRAEAIRIASGYCHFSNIPKELEKLPSVQPKATTGRWIEEEMYYEDICYRCSECDEVFCLIEGTPELNEYHFCPNCGARMESEEQTE